MAIFNPPKLPGATSVIPSSVRNPSAARDAVKGEVARLPQLAINEAMKQAEELLFPKTETQETGSGETKLGPISKGIDDRPDPKFSFQWSAILPDMGVYPFDSRYYVESANLPMPFFDAEAVFQEGRNVYYAGLHDIGTMSLTFYEDSYMSAMQYLMAWQRGIKDTSSSAAARDKNIANTYNPSGVYKHEMRFEMLIPGGASDPIQATPGGQNSLTLIYGDCFPTQISGYEFNSENGRIVVTAEFSVSTFQMEAGNPVLQAKMESVAKNPQQPGFFESMLKNMNPFSITDRAVRDVTGVFNSARTAVQSVVSSGPSTIRLT